MALRCSAALLKGSIRPRARDLQQPSAIVNPARPNDAIRQLGVLKRLARQNGTVQRTFRTMRREFPTDSRTTDLTNQVYFRKWHHLKYCTQMIQYSIRRGLRLRDEIEEEASMTQKPWAENVSTSFLGSGRLHKDDANHGKLDAELVKKAGDKVAAQKNDAGFKIDELRKLAAGTCRVNWQAPRGNAKTPAE
eukprot:TRINITY_DN33197_c0_g1_i1.p1 TRINITY_DN33197_c0_g1~~TRINITY_DN33197_c0_g1_i1.p1  ORF type:complete len:210 (-),score=31.68 TRINITY_DN33197_c0_g1_i1:53-628(-)